MHPIRLEVPFIREDWGNKVFMQEERVKSWRGVHSIL